MNEPTQEATPDPELVPVRLRSGFAYSSSSKVHLPGDLLELEAERASALLGYGVVERR